MEGITPWVLDQGGVPVAEEVAAEVEGLGAAEEAVGADSFAALIHLPLLHHQQNNQNRIEEVLADQLITIPMSRSSAVS